MYSLLVCIRIIVYPYDFEGYSCINGGVCTHDN